MSRRLKVSGPFFEKTGHPSNDNFARNVNRAIQKRTPQTMRVHAKGRARRRKLFHIEGDHFQHLMAAVMNDRTRRLSASADVSGRVGDHIRQPNPEEP